MNPCNESFKESYLSIVNISSQQVSLQHCFVVAFTHTIDIINTIVSIGSVDKQSQYLISLVKVEDRGLPPWIRELSDVPAQVRLATAGRRGTS